MAFTPPSNEALAGNLSYYEQERYQEYRKAAMRIAAENPALDSAVLTHYLHDYLNAANQHRAAIVDVNQRANSAGVVPSSHWMQQESKQFRKRFTEDFVQNVLPQYGHAGKELWQKHAYEINDKPIFGQAIKQIYDSNKGGVQLGGVIGAVLGALASSQIVPAGQGWLGVTGYILGTGMGAVLGNMASDYIQSRMRRESPVYPTQSAPQHTRQPGEERSQTRAAAPASPSPGHDSNGIDVNNGATGNLTPSALPLQPSAPATHIPPR